MGMMLTKNPFRQELRFLLHLVETLLETSRPSEEVLNLKILVSSLGGFQSNKLREGYEGNPPASNGLREPEGQQSLSP
jgi:hypothetical protein